MALSPAAEDSDRSSQAEITRSIGKQRALSRLADWMWCAGTLIALWLPLLSGLGYRPLDPEMLALILISTVSAAVIVVTTMRTTVLRLLFLSLVVFAILDVYVIDTANWIKAGVVFAVVAGLIWVTRDHALRIIGVGSMAFSAAVLVTASPLVPAPFNFDTQESPTTQSPSVIHLILDEHGGPGGLPPEIFSDQQKVDLIERYERQGFKVYTNVSASAHETKFSIFNLMNGQTTTPESLREAWRPFRFDKQSQRGFEYEMKTNQYLASAIARGYQVHVLQSSYLDICTEAFEERFDCRSYPHTSASVLRDLALSPSDRKLILFGLINWKLTSQRSSFLYDEWSRTGPGERISQRLHAEAPNRLPPLVAWQMLDYFSQELSKAPRGQVLVAHLLLPHRPYVFDAHCNIVPSVEWREGDKKIDNVESRREIYLRYYGQMACADKRIAALISAALRNPLLRDATFIIHGDHGSRNGPYYASTLGPTYSKSDFENDWYTTLFAIRSPSTIAGTSDERLTLTDVFWASLESAFAANGEMAQKK